MHETPTKLRAVIIDDEDHARTILTALLRRADAQIEVVAQAANLRAGVEQIVAHRPEVVFLDIEMPGLSGLQIRTLLPSDIHFFLIFVTAYDQYAIQAMRLTAIDYLLKPLDWEDLCGCLARLRSRVTVQEDLQLRLRALEANRQSHSLEKMVIVTQQGARYIDLPQLSHLEADGMYTLLHLTGERILTSKPIKHYEAILPDTFFRIHRSHIVNLAHVQGYHRHEGATVVLKDGTELQLARNRRESFLRTCKEKGV